MQNIKNIIFDYGNVIFTINFEKVQQALRELGIKNVEAFFGHRIQDTVFDEFDRGNISAADFRQRIREVAARHDLTDEQIDKAWNAILIGIADGNHDLLLRIKKRYRTFLLSNINDIHYKWIMKYLNEQFGFENNDDLFDKAYYSHFTGMRKPEAALFNLVLQENNLKAEETLFIDDSPQHIAAARQLGLQTFLMTAPDTLQKYFERNGLLD